MLFPKWIYISSGFQEKLKNHQHFKTPLKNLNPPKILKLPRIIKTQNKKMNQRSICLSQKWKHVFSRVVVVQKKINNTILAIVEFKKEITYANDGE